MKPVDIRAQAAAEVERRKRAGLWSGGVRAHSEFEGRILDWIVEKLGVPRETLAWSMNPEYQACGCRTEACQGGCHKWDADVDPFVAATIAVQNGDDVGIESATGTGKTYWLACMVLAFLAIYEDSLVVTAAPKADQLYLNLWKEIGVLWPKFQAMFPSAELLTGKIRMKPAESDKEKWAAVAFVAGVGADEESATKAQGFHAAHMLIITEETPGMDPAIMNALFNTRTDDHNVQVAVGNPDHQQDELHRFCETPGVVKIRISALDHPNIVTGRSVVPGAIGPKRLAQRITKMGVGSRLYQSRVRGISPTESEDALIRWEWCEAAWRRYDDPELRMGEEARGVDVANSDGGDKAAIARWQGAVCTEVVSKPCPDASVLGKEVVKEARDAGIDPRCVGVDGVGVGASTVNKANEMGFRVRDLKGGAKSIPLVHREPSADPDLIEDGKVVVESERYANLRSQMWYRMREDLRLNRIGLPNDPELWKDLCTPSYKTQGGKIVVEGKEEIFKRLRRSPDKGDACVYGNWVRKRPKRPPKPKEEEPKSDRNVDRGLERLLQKRAKNEAAERRVQERQLRRLMRGAR